MRILLPTDHSDNSFKAIRYCMEFLGSGHEWVLLNTYQPPHGGASLMVKIVDIMARQSKEELTAFTKKVQSEFDPAEYPLTSLSESGPVLHCIDYLCDRTHYDLIALGTTGASGLKEVLMGSVAANIVEKSKVPVLAIPSAAKYNGLNTLAVADDLAPVNNTQAIAFMLPTIERHKPALKLVHVSSKKNMAYDSSTSGIDELFSNFKPSYHISNDTDIARGLRKFNKENKVDILILLQRKESAFLKWLIVSTSEEMAMHARVPLLVLKD